MLREVLILYFYLSISVVATAQEELPLVTGEWPPYVSEDLDNHGVVAELTTAVVAEMGMKANYLFVPWVRAEKMVSVGKVFAAFPYAKNKFRARNFDFSDPLLLTKSVFFYYKPHNDRISYKSFADLRSYKIAGGRGFFYMKLFREAGLEVQAVNSREQLLRLLQKGRVDLVPIDLFGGRNDIAKLFPNESHEFAYIDKRIERDEGEAGSHLMISRRYPDAKKLTTKFNQALVRLKANGVYAAILGKYGY